MSTDIKKYRMLLENAMKESAEDDRFEEEYFDLPSHWGSALVNGDYSGYSDEEEEEINNFLDENPMAHSITGNYEELGFQSANDANNLGGDVTRFHAMRPKKKDEEIEESEELEERSMDILPNTVTDVKSYKHHIAQNFDEFKENIKRLYPADQKATADVFARFLKSQELDMEKLEELHSTLSKKIRDFGDAYDEMASFVEKVIKFNK